MFLWYGPLCDSGPLGFRFGRVHTFDLKWRIYHSPIKATLGEPMFSLGNQTNDHPVHYVCCTWEKKQQVGSTARDRWGYQYLPLCLSLFLTKQSLPSDLGTWRFSICKPFPWHPSIHPFIPPKTEKSCTGYAFSQVFLREDVLPYHLMFLLLCNQTENMQIILLANAKYGTTKSSTNNSSAPGHRFGKAVNYYTLGLYRHKEEYCSEVWVILQHREINVHLLWENADDWE